MQNRASAPLALWLNYLNRSWNRVICSRWKFPLPFKKVVPTIIYSYFRVTDRDSDFRCTCNAGHQTGGSPPYHLPPLQAGSIWKEPDLSLFLQKKSSLHLVCFIAQRDSLWLFKLTQCMAHGLFMLCLLHWVRQVHIIEQNKNCICCYPFLCAS